MERISPPEKKKKKKKTLQTFGPFLAVKKSPGLGRSVWLQRGWHPDDQWGYGQERLALQEVPPQQVGCFLFLFWNRKRLPFEEKSIHEVANSTFFYCVKHVKHRNFCKNPCLSTRVSCLGGSWRAWSGCTRTRSLETCWCSTTVAMVRNTMAIRRPCTWAENGEIPASILLKRDRCQLTLETI